MIKPNKPQNRQNQKSHLSPPDHQAIKKICYLLPFHLVWIQVTRFFSGINILSTKKAGKDSLELLNATVCTGTKLPTSLFCGLNSSKGIKWCSVCFWGQSCKDLLKVIKYTAQGCIVLKTLWRRKVDLMKRRNHTFPLVIYFVLQTAEEMHLLQWKGSKLWLVF